MARIYQNGLELRSSRDHDGVSLGGSGTSTVTWVAGRYQGYCISVGNSGNGANSGLVSFNFSSTPLTEGYYRLPFLWTGAASSSHLYISNGSQTLLAFTGVNGSVQTITINNGATTLGTTLLAPNNGNWTVIEIYFKCVNASDGRLVVKYDGVTVFDYTGNTNPSGYAAPSWVTFASGTAAGAVARVDDLAINDTTGSVNNSWVGDGSIALLLPNANGDSSQFVGSDGNSTDNYLLVDDNPANDGTDYVATTTSSQKDLYNLQSMPALGAGGAINTVQPFHIGIRMDAGVVTAIKSGLKSGSTEAWGSSQNLTTSYALYRGTIHETDPNTSSAWTESAVNALQAGVQSV
jgi:hypothetical protein